MTKLATETFDAERVLQDAFNDDDASLQELSTLHDGKNVDDLLLVDDLKMDPTIDSVLLTIALKKALGTQISPVEIVHTVVQGRLGEAEAREHTKILGRTEFVDGDQQGVEKLLRAAGITRGDLKRAMITIAAKYEEK